MTAFKGSWYNHAHRGEGVMMDESANGKVNGGYYTFQDGEPHWYGFNGQRVGNEAVCTLIEVTGDYRYEGGLFAEFPVVEEPAGELTLTDLGDKIRLSVHMDGFQPFGYDLQNIFALVDADEPDPVPEPEPEPEPEPDVDYSDFILDHDNITIGWNRAEIFPFGSASVHVGIAKAKAGQVMHTKYRLTAVKNDIEITMASAEKKHNAEIKGVKSGYIIKKGDSKLITLHAGPLKSHISEGAAEWISYQVDIADPNNPAKDRTIIWGGCVIKLSS